MELKDLFGKISSYNIFNHLLPGALFCIIGTKISNINFIQTDILNGFFVYYFAGVIISRIGSIAIYPFFKKIGFIKFAPYAEYIQGSKNDPKIEVLSETNNMYRTLTSLFVCLLMLKGFVWLANESTFISEHKNTLVLLILAVVFSMAYRKQTEQIKDRIKNAK